MGGRQAAINNLVQETGNGIEGLTDDEKCHLLNEFVVEQSRCIHSEYTDILLVKFKNENNNQCRTYTRLL